MEELRAAETDETPDAARESYVGTLVGESTSREFRIAVAKEAIREQDIIAVDVTLQQPGGEGEPEELRLWAKVQSIERINPLFPKESGHELAETQTNPFDTVMSLSREMVTAVCQILGSEPRDGSGDGELEQVRYPPKPASKAYRPDTDDVRRVVLGEMSEEKNRGLDIAELANRPNVDVVVDGHAIVKRHLAILAMTGAGKSVTARRIIEELAEKNYPAVIFDPHGDYTGLDEVADLKDQVQRYYATLPIFEEDPDKVVQIVESLAWDLSDTQRQHFSSLFRGAESFLDGEDDSRERAVWLSDYLGNPNIEEFGIRPNLYFVADFVEAIVQIGRNEDDEARQRIHDWTGNDYSSITPQVANWIEGLTGRLRTAAKAIRRMTKISRQESGGADPLPTERTELVKHGQISVISLAGYSPDFQATIYNLIASDIFDSKVQDDLKYPVLFLLEEAHNFVPNQSESSAVKRSIATTRQIAQEGRKFGVGLIMISQRPSRLDETALSMCNSYVIQRMVNPADQRFVRRVVESLGEDDADMLPDLEVGEAILSGQFINFPVLVKVKTPQSEGEHEEGDDAFSELEEIHQRVQHE